MPYPHNQRRCMATQVWHLDFFTAGVQYGAEAPVAMEPEWLRLNSEAAADEVRP